MKPNQLTHCDLERALKSVCEECLPWRGRAQLPNLRDQFSRIHVEPSGDPFNSLVQLEYENGIPRNPFINAGALVATDH